MAESVRPGVFFELPEGLPRGQHRLSRKQVRDAQRERLLTAFTELLADRGYAKLRVADVAGRAAVSNNTFYELFANKEDCACAAFDRFVEVVRRGAASAGVGESRTWREFIQAAVGGYFDVLAADPVVARAFHVDMDTIGPVARKRQATALLRFAEHRMRAEKALRRDDPLLKARPFSVHLGSIHVEHELAREALEASTEPDFHQLSVELVEWFVASWYG